MEFIDNHTEVTTTMAIGIPYAEPVPVWDDARAAWAWTWSIHTYCLGAVFLSIAVFMFITVTKLYSKCTNHKYVVTLNSMLLVCGLCRGLYLLVDPYGSLKVLPVTFSMLIFGVGHPCLTSAFSLLQWAFMRVTQVKLGPWRFPSYKALSIFLFFHFATVISTNTIVSLQISMKLLLTINEGIFIIWGFVLCGIFIFKGFKITQFTSETQKALKQLSMYNQFKNDPDSKKKEMNVKRVKRPKIRITNDDDDTYSVLTDSTSGCSDSSISCHVTRFTFEKPVKAIALPDDILDEPEEVTLLQRANKVEDAKQKHQSVEIVMNDDTITVVNHSNDFEEDEKVGVTTRDSFDYSRDSPVSNATSQAESNGRYFCDIEPSDTECSSLGSGSGSVYTVEEIVHLTKTSNLRQSKSTSPFEICTAEKRIGNGIARSKSLDLKSASKSDEFTVVPLDGETGSDVIEMRETDLGNSHDDVGDFDIRGVQDRFCETGYMADTEYGSPKSGKHSRKQSMDALSDDSRWGEVKASKKISDNCSTISFHRIRQGRVLHKLVKVTYLTTMFQFILCILQLYAMFGVYGVIGKDITIDPWPWFTFQTCFRLAEIGMCATMSYVTFCLGKSRQKASERNRRKKCHLKDAKLGYRANVDSGSD